MRTVRFTNRYRTAEVAEILNCHPKTVLREIKRGRLTGHKVGREWRVSEDALQNYENHRNSEELEGTP